MRSKALNVAVVLLGLGCVASGGRTEEATAPLPSRYTLWAEWNALNGDPYVLDAIPRRLEDPKARVACAKDGLVEYRGTTVRYAGSVVVSSVFRERLERFETVLDEVARETYGRAPRRLRHLGAYVCRRSRTRSHMVSEHALGNAIDVLGFDFGPASKTDTLPPDLPKHLRGPFEVRVAKHWDRTSTSTAALHARFLRTLTDRLTERRDIFRSMFGPGHRGHADHFHFDVSPWRYVNL
ncbi:MAG TPA: extensin family protein [Polyangiaceae bacterium]